jgi:uncharacterized repeat protein (TIGR01451 family)
LVAGNTVGPVTVTAASGNSTPATFTVTVIGTGPERADLVAALTVPTNAKAGSAIPLTVVLTNKGPSRATTVRAALSLPAGFSVVSAGGGTVRGGLVTLAAPSLESGRSITYTVVVKAQAGGRGVRLLAAVAVSQTRDPVVLNNVAVKRVVLA